ncbi:MAG TPA: hypothetical protein VLI92_02665 [Candidatus Saccharimonadales bacterium]|nr:hypothetical protein [Candidatus Saccharimonadales bacterium]
MHRKRKNPVLGIVFVGAMILSTLAVVFFRNSTPATNPTSEVQAAASVAKLESSYVPVSLVLDKVQPMTPKEKVDFAMQFRTGTVNFLYDASQTVADVNSLSIYVPSVGVTPDSLNSLLGYMAQFKGAYNMTSLNYVLAHWTNHMDDVGVSHNDIGAAAAYAQQVIRAAINGEGVMFCRPDDGFYQEACFFAARMGTKIWGIWVDPQGRPITAYVANQKDLGALTTKYLRDGYTLVTNEDDIPPDIIKNWLGGAIPTLKFYVWSLQKMAEMSAADAGVSVTQALTNMSAATMWLDPVSPVIISPCLLSPSLAGCGASNNT